MQKSQVRRASALLVGLTLVVAACGSDSSSGGATTAAPETTAAAVETTAAAVETTAAAVETTVAAGGNELKGMKGTTPLVKLSDDFKTRLQGTPSGKGLTDYNYAGETYDAIVVIALAAAEAKTDGSAMADHIVGITKDGTKCTDFKSCLDIINAGGDPDYDGQSGPITMNGNGEPLEASYGILVFGDGNPSSGLMLVGEGPGAEEDRAGLPFVGASGQFLDRMLASIGLDRSNVYITNLIPWRPPGNRNPTDAEIVVCLPFLLRHIALVRPKLLVLLGNLSVQSVTQSKTGITRARGKWQDVEIEGMGRVRALPMLHPAYLLRNHGAKREAWADMVTLRRALDQG